MDRFLPIFAVQVRMLNMGCLSSCVKKGASSHDSDTQPILWNAPERKKYQALAENMADEDIMDFLAAFEAGDKDRSGTLNTGEFIRLMVVLGVPGGVDRARAILRQINKNGDAVITQSEYMQAIKQLGVQTTQIRRMKQVFDIFDHDRTGWASKTDVINGLHELGVPIEGDLKKNLERLDANKDGKIWFPDFLRVQLNI